MRPTPLRAALWTLALASTLAAQTSNHKRALIVGINDYSASHLGPPAAPGTVPERDWPNLSGAVNDATALQEMLVAAYGFDRSDIVTLVDQDATRAAIMDALDQHLAAKASKDDVLLFYYAGHGSQVKNSLSDERDKLDESIVPADSRLGARDIRDKELRALFNRILDRGARLTLIFDNCHSGSAARGLATGAQRRAIRADNRDVADRTTSPRPENRGALVLSASQDYENAWETRDEEKKFHGTFSWALLRAMRDAATGEPAVETFLRAQARMRAETPFQEPVLAGNNDARLTPLLGTRIDRRNDRTVLAVQRLQDETVILQGGWANGLTAGSQLRVLDSGARLIVTAIRGMGQSEARIQTPGTPIHPGALAEVETWSAPPLSPLRVWMPKTSRGVEDIATVAHHFSAEAAQYGVRWITDPIDVTPTHLLRQRDREWELLGPSETEHLPSDDAAFAAVAKLPAGSSLFVQFAAPVALIEAIGTDKQGVACTDRPEAADYVLVGRYTTHHLSYAWLRPGVKRSDRRKTGLPLRTKWIPQRRNDEAFRNTAPLLRDLIAPLRKVHAWNILDSPSGARYPYEIAIRRARDGEMARDSVTGGEKYVLVLRVRSLPMPQHVPQRYIYAFVVDSNGKSTLLFPPPESGSVENRFPLLAPDDEIELGDVSAFEAAAPYGVDTYFLLSTDEPLPDPMILEWDGVRGPRNQQPTPLEEILQLTSSGRRSISLPTPLSWSVDKTFYESMPARAQRGH